MLLLASAGVVLSRATDASPSRGDKYGGLQRSDQAANESTPPVPPSAPPIAAPVVAAPVVAAPEVAAPVVTERRGPKAVTATRPPPQPKKRTVAAERGRISVRVTPWANVRVDGKLLGVTPVPSTDIPAGRHELVLEHPPTGQSRTVIVDVPPNGEIVVKETFLGSPQGR